MSDIIVTTHDELGNEHQGSRMRLNGKSVPYGFAGYVPQDAGYALCHECADGDEIASDEGGLIYGNSEADYPGMICEECDEYLDTYLLVYQSNNPKLYFRLRMSEELGEYDDCLTIEEIAECAKEEAYELGWNEGEAVEGTYGEGGEFEDSYPEFPTDSARWANVIAPKLRSIAGYEDSGRGTFQEVPIDEAQWIYQEDVREAFERGYADRLEGEEYGHTLE